MSRYCVVRTCKARVAEAIQQGHQPINHTFPRVEKWKLKWCLFVHEVNRTHSEIGKKEPKGNRVLCSRHFSPSCYTSKGRLNKNAVPTIADKFTAAVAVRYNLIPSLDSHELDSINNFSPDIVRTVVDSGALALCAADNITVNPITRISSDYLDDSDNLSDYPKDPLSLDCIDYKDVIVPKGEALDNDHVSDGSSSKSGDDCVKGGSEFELNGSFVSLSSPMSKPCYQAAKPNSGNDCTKDGSLPQRIETVTHSCTPTTSDQPSARRKRKHYVLELTPSDFVSPHQREKNVERMKTEIVNVRKRLKLSQQQRRRALKTVESLKKLVEILKDKKSVPPRFGTLLEVNMPQNSCS